MQAVLTKCAEERMHVQMYICGSSDECLRGDLSRDHDADLREWLLQQTRSLVLGEPRHIDTVHLMPT